MATISGSVSRKRLELAMLDDFADPESLLFGVCRQDVVVSHSGKPRYSSNTTLSISKQCALCLVHEKNEDAVKITDATTTALAN